MFLRCWPVPGAKACDELLECYCLHVKTLEMQLLPDVIAIKTSVSRNQTSKCEKNATAIEKESRNAEEYRRFL